MGFEIGTGGWAGEGADEALTGAAGAVEPFTAGWGSHAEGVLVAVVASPVAGCCSSVGLIEPSGVESVAAESSRLGATASGWLEFVLPGPVFACRPLVSW